jgi:hypothetical protein
VSQKSAKAMQEIGKSDARNRQEECALAHVTTRKYRLLQYMSSVGKRTARA